MNAIINVKMSIMIKAKHSFFISLFHLLILFHPFDAFGQQDSIRPLKIGDKVPDVLIENLLNYPGGKAKLSDFKGKLLIIDFWSKYCSACIAMFPKLESMEKDYNGKVKFIAATRNTRKELETLFINSNNVKNSQLTMLLGEKILNTLFPHGAEPFQTWIDKNGYVLAFTGSESCNTRVIDNILAGNKFNVKDMRFDQLDFDKNAPLIMEGQGRQWEYLGYYSMIMKRIKGSPKTMSGYMNDPNGKTLRFSAKFLNCQLRELYRYAYDFDLPNFYTVVEDDDSSSFFHTTDIARIGESRNSLYSYEIAVHPSKAKLLKQFMQQDLESYFGLTATVETRNIDCYILRRTNPEIRIETSGGNGLVEKTKKGILVKNGFFQEVSDFLISKFTIYYQAPLLIDETKLGSVKVDISIENGLDNLKALDAELGKYGLSVIKEKRSIKCMVLKQNTFWQEGNLK